MADEWGVVHRDADLLDLLEVAAHGLPVEGPAEGLLHPLVDLLNGVIGLPRVELVWIQLRQVIPQEPWHPDVLAQGGRGAAALAPDEGGHPLHDVALALGVPEEGPVGVAVGVDEPGDRVQALRFHGLHGVALHVAEGHHLVTLDADGALVRPFSRPFHDGCVLYENIELGHENLRGDRRPSII